MRKYFPISLLGLMNVKATVLRLLQRQTPEQYRIVETVDGLARLVASNTVEEQLALDDALSASRFLIARNPKASRQLLTEMGWSPVDAAALFVLQYCRRELESGRHHACRGVLMEKGMGYHRVFDACVDHLRKAGRYDVARAERERDALAEAIQQAGQCDWPISGDLLESEDSESTSYIRPIATPANE